MRPHLPLLLLGLATCVSACGPLHQARLDGEPCATEDGVDPTSLRALGERAGVVVGAAVTPPPEGKAARYDRVLRREFGGITPEWTMKWAPLQPTPDTWDFIVNDRIVDCARARGQRVKGHALVWYRELPGWLPTEQAALQDALDLHIRRTVSHYRGRVDLWDVVNEAIADDGSLRDDVLSRVLGKDWIARAFLKARAADPSVPLFYNDYDLARLSPRSDAALRLLAGLKSSKVPLDGVGFQMHLQATVPVSPSELRERLAAFGGLGLKVEVSELDVQVRGLARIDRRYREEVQAIIVGEVAAACVESGVCTGITTWGVADAESWVDREVAPDAPLLFDDRYRPKLARDALAAGLRGQRPAVCEAVDFERLGPVAVGGRLVEAPDGGVRVTERSETWHGPGLQLVGSSGGGLKAKDLRVHRVRAKVGVVGVLDASAPTSEVVRLQLTARFKAGGKTVYLRLGQVDVVNDELADLEAMLVVPEVDLKALDEVVLYVEGAPVGYDVVALGWQLERYCAPGR